MMHFLLIDETRYGLLINNEHIMEVYELNYSLATKGSEGLLTLNSIPPDFFVCKNIYTDILYNYASVRMRKLGIR